MPAEGNLSLEGGITLQENLVKAIELVGHC
jgi:hypothetical protein